ncbi:hypothetical protein KC963_02505 [Candidatus Saccharibacteria bacterium]|nr:hypothetical protein [Candidatus Saccharibacteria bacterium]
MASQKQSTPVVKGVRTFLQTIAGLLVGLVAAVWSVPGVPEAVTAYVQANFVPLLIGLAVFVGIPSGVVAWLQNRLGK